jgi:dienelactone hydrolase
MSPETLRGKSALSVLSRRQALLLAVPAYAQTRFPGLSYRNYPRCLPDYLRRLAAAAVTKREAALGLLTTRDAIHRRQKWARATLLDLIGGLPERTDLNARTLDATEYEDYRLERLVYESRPKYFISALLYIPRKGRAPFPGVLFQLGHSANGKSYDSYQCACQGLVKLGFLVLAFDPMGQGERIYYPDSTGLSSRLHDVDLEHTVPGRQMLLAGDTCTQFQLWDAIRSLDHLESHPLVDKKKLASCGQSGGATLTMLLAAVDDRLAAAAEMSGNTENVACPNFLPPGSTDDAEQDFVWSGPLGFDRWDLFYPFAPKPMLVGISDRDFFGTYSPNYVAGSRREYQRLEGIYKTLGAERNLGWTDTALPHGLSYDSRLQMYNWLRRHLMGENEPLTEEPAVSPEPDRKLWVSPQGSTVAAFGSETPFSLTKKRCETLMERQTPKPLDRLLRLEQPSGAKASVLRTMPSRDGLVIEAVDVPSVTGVGLPVWVFRSKSVEAQAPVVILLNPQGRSTAWHEGQLYPSLASGAGCIVCAADVRGVGDLRPEFSAGAPGYAHAHQDEENYAWGSLILGRPLVGQRTADILALARALRDINGPRRPVVVAALRGMTVPALFAAALEPAIGRLYLAGGLSTFRSIAENENYTHSLADFVPGILAHTDLPEVAAALAPRRAIFAAMVDGKGDPLSLADARRVYKPALAGGHLEIREKAEWSAAGLARIIRS